MKSMSIEHWTAICERAIKMSNKVININFNKIFTSLGIRKRRLKLERRVVYCYRADKLTLPAASNG